MEQRLRQLRSEAHADPEPDRELVGGPDSSGPIARLVWQKVLSELLDEELAPLRSSLARLESVAVTAARSPEPFSEQLGYLRARTEGLSHLLDGRQAEISRRLIQLEADLTARRASDLAVQERANSQLERAQRTTARAVTELAEASSLLLNQVESGFASSQRSVAELNARLRRTVVALLALNAVVLAVALWAVLVRA